MNKHWTERSNVCYCVSIFEYSRHCILNMTRVFNGWPDDRGCDRCALIGQLLQEGPPGGVQENISLIWPSAFVLADLQMTGIKIWNYDYFSILYVSVCLEIFLKYQCDQYYQFCFITCCLDFHENRQSSNFDSPVIRIKHLNCQQ